MPIDKILLETAARRFGPRRARTVQEAKLLGAKTAFLSHSHHDANLAKGLERLLNEAGWDVYIDWDDVEMPDTPNRQTAERIQRKIVEHHYFLFLATANSMRSRWCPWEIGYADGKKDLDRILVVPTREGSSTYGNEYLQLYRRIDFLADQRLGSWYSGSTHGVLVENL